MDPWNALTSAKSLLNTDISYSQVLAAKQALKLLADNKETITPIIQLCLACSDNDAYTIKELLTDSPALLNFVDSKGLTPLIYAICFNNKECVDLLLTFNVDCNEPDSLIGWTPTMWATHLDHNDLVERLVSSGADPLKKVGKSMKNAISLVKEGSRCYDYFKIHGYMDRKEETLLKEFGTDKSYERTGFLANHLSGSPSATSGDNRFIDNNNVFNDLNIEKVDFNFNFVQEKQYLRFNDNSIGPIFEYIFELPKRHHNKPIYPSAILFQCLRYAEYKLENGNMVLTLMDLYLSKIRSVTDTKSGVVQFFGLKEKKERERIKKKEKDATPDPLPVDIVTLGFWISAVNHLYYFLVRDTACDFLHKYPQLLQDLIICLQSLVSKLSFTIDAKLEPMIESCILDYNSVPNMEVIYQNEWKIFKNKNADKKKTSYDEILDMLYPPSYAEQMKPSPLKIIQTLGGLLYVLELYYISDVIKQQVLSSVLYYIGCELFNKVISTKRLCSRVKAMEIRLNLSYIQDWLRSNNLQPFIEENGTLETVSSWKNDGFPDNLVGKDVGYLTNVCRYEGNFISSFDATFYMNSLFKIGQYSLQPIIELAEWLQIMTGIQDLESLTDVIDKFEVLSSSTMVQCIRNYHYEVNEKKFSKSLKKWLKENPQNESDIGVTERLFYKDDTKLSLNSGQVFPVVLPKPIQLLHQYGADFTQVDSAKLMANQPNIPIDIRDDIETLVDENDGKRDENEDDYENEYDHESSYSENDDYEEPTASPGGNPRNSEEDFTFQGETTSASGLEKSNNNFFKELSEPTMAARKTWEDDNPWA